MLEVHCGEVILIVLDVLLAKSVTRMAVAPCCGLSVAGILDLDSGCFIPQHDVLTGGVGCSRTSCAMQHGCLRLQHFQPCHVCVLGESVACTWGVSTANFRCSRVDQRLTQSYTSRLNAICATPGWMQWIRRFSPTFSGATHDRIDSRIPRSWHRLERPSQNSFPTCHAASTAR